MSEAITKQASKTARMNVVRRAINSALENDREVLVDVTKRLSFSELKELAEEYTANDWHCLILEPIAGGSQRLEIRIR